MGDSRDFTGTHSPALDTSTRNGTEQMASPFAEIVAYFEREHKGRFLLDQQKQTIRWVVSGTHGTVTIVVLWDEKTERLVIRVPNITTVPMEKRVGTAVLNDLINWQLAIGNFELDVSDGELAFRCNLMVGDGQLGQRQLESHCLASVMAVDHFMPAFQRLLWSDASPDAALASLT